MKTEQIYTLVNEISRETMGESAIQAVDTSTLVALGDSIINSQDNVENFCKVMVQRIARTIISYREYQNQLGGLVLGDFEFGAIVQKIKVKMPTATEDEMYDLEDGKSLDMYVVNKPKAKQKLFVKRTPYKIYITIQTVALKEAFTNSTAMGSFMSAVRGEIKNKLELTIENLGRLCMANYMCLAKPNQIVNLVSNYNSAKGLSGANVMTAEKAMFDGDFLRYAIGQINLYSRKMKTMSTLYNAEGEERHTPYERQFYVTLSDFTTQLETVVQYEAFHTQYVEKVSDIDVPYWQAAQSPSDISLTVENPEDGTTKAVELNNVVAFIFDRDALGTYRREEMVLNTPMNARGAYFNVFYHEQQLWFNDLSENGVVFTLN